jgi:hypothetical protein
LGYERHEVPSSSIRKREDVRGPLKKRKRKRKKMTTGSSRISQIRQRNPESRVGE